MSADLQECEHCHDRTIHCLLNGVSYCPVDLLKRNTTLQADLSAAKVELAESEQLYRDADRSADEWMERAKTIQKKRDDLSRELSALRAGRGKP
jgi:hypothetical protein